MTDFEPSRYSPTGNSNRSSWGRPKGRRFGRENSYRRGYDKAWIRVRDLYLSWHPFCEDCADRRPRDVVVDHIVPISAVDPYDDPLRLDERDFRTRCYPHHAIKTDKYDDEIRHHFDELAGRLGHDRALELTVSRYRECVARIKVM